MQKSVTSQLHSKLADLLLLPYDPWQYDLYRNQGDGNEGYLVRRQASFNNLQHGDIINSCKGNLRGKERSILVVQWFL